MPTRERVQDLVAHVEAGRIVDAIDTFYAPDVTMQDNLGEPTVGRSANRERLEANVAGIRDVREHRAVRVLVDGDHAVINWHFRITLLDGTRLDFDQVALQEWRGTGDEAQIIRERFVFDSNTIAVDG